MKWLGWPRRSTTIRYDMFDVSRSAEEARRAVKLESLYHRGQDLAWDGKDVLAELIQKHGGIHLSEEKRRALGAIFDTILWGELAAWRISAELADQIVELEPKMAATSQAHDEARHFYVMYDYLTAMGYRPAPMGRASETMLDLVLETRSLAKKLIGMQLMVETMALTLFQAVRELRVEPVLSDLLRYYEKDEARHVGLGIQYLPYLMKRMSFAEGTQVFFFQMRVIGWSLASLKSLEPHLRVLGIEPRDIMNIGRAKQVLAFDQLWQQMGFDQTPRSREMVMRFVNGVSQIAFPERADGQPGPGPVPTSPLELLGAFRRGWAIPLERIAGAQLAPDEPPATKAA